MVHFFQTSPIFESKLTSLRAFQANARLMTKMLVTNALAYFDPASVPERNVLRRRQQLLRQGQRPKVEERERLQSSHQKTKEGAITFDRVTLIL